MKQLNLLKQKYQPENSTVSKNHGEYLAIVDEMDSSPFDC